jgi:hypothetical protein
MTKGHPFIEIVGINGLQDCRRLPGSCEFGFAASSAGSHGLLNFLSQVRRPDTRYGLFGLR